MTFLYWREKKSGELYAVRIDDAGVVDGAAGPLPPDEVTAAKLHQWTFDQKGGKP